MRRPNDVKWYKTWIQSSKSSSFLRVVVFILLIFPSWKKNKKKTSTLALGFLASTYPSQLSTSPFEPFSTPPLPYVFIAWMDLLRHCSIFAPFAAFPVPLTRKCTAVPSSVGYDVEALGLKPAWFPTHFSHSHQLWCFKVMTQHCAL